MLLPMVDGAIRRELGYDPVQRTDTEWYPRVETTSPSNSSRTWDSNGTVAYITDTGRAETLQLHRLPVRAITEIRVDYNGGFGQKASTFGASTVWTEGEDYYQELVRAGLNMTGNVFSMTGWPREPGTVKVTYSAGYSNDEFAGRASSAIDAGPIKLAAVEGMIATFKEIKINQKQGNAGFLAGPMTSERLGSYGYSLDSASAGMISGMQINLPPKALMLLAPFRHFGWMRL